MVDTQGQRGAEDWWTPPVPRGTYTSSEVDTGAVQYAATPTTRNQEFASDATPGGRSADLPGPRANPPYQSTDSDIARWSQNDTEGKFRKTKPDYDDSKTPWFLQPFQHLIHSGQTSSSQWDEEKEKNKIRYEQRRLEGFNEDDIKYEGIVQTEEALQVKTRLTIEGSDIPQIKVNGQYVKAVWNKGGVQKGKYQPGYWGPEGVGLSDSQRTETNVRLQEEKINQFNRKIGLFVDNNSENNRPLDAVLKKTKDSTNADVEYLGRGEQKVNTEGVVTDVKSGETYR